MAKARGRVEKLDLLQVSGLDSRIWQKEGTSTDNLGVVYSLAGEVVKSRGIQPVVDWITLKRAINKSVGSSVGSPFYTESTGTKMDLMSIGAFNMNGAVEILLEYGGTLAVVRGREVEVLQSGRFEAERPSEGTQFLQVGNAVIILNGRDQNMKWDGLSLTPLGIQVPPSPPQVLGAEDGSNTGNMTWVVSGTPTPPVYPGSAIDKAAGALVSSYRYKMTWVNNQGTESEPSAVSNVISDTNVNPTGTNISAMFVKVGGLSQPTTRADLVSRRLYRGGVDGLQYYLLASLPGTSTDVYMDSSEHFYTSSVSIPADGMRSPPPLSSMAMQFRGRTYYAGNPAAPRNLYYSSPGGLKEEVPQPDNVVLVNASDGSDEITALAVVSDYGLVFTKRSVHMLTEDRDGRAVVTPVSQTIGAVGRRSVIDFEDKIFFFSEQGIFVYEGGSPKPLSREVSSLVEDLPRAFLKDVVAFADPDGRRVCFSICAGPSSSNNEVWAIHVDTGALSRLPFRVFDAMRYKGETLVSYGVQTKGDLLVSNVSSSTGSSIFLGLGSVQPDQTFVETNLGMWDCQTSISGTNEIPAYFDTRWVVGNNPESDKTFYRVDIFYVQTGDFDLSVSWCADWKNDFVGTQAIKPRDPDALIWGEVAKPLDPLVAPLDRAWNNAYASGFVPKNPKKWDTQRVRSKRIGLNANLNLLDNRSPDPSGEGLTCKAFKLRFGSSDSGGDIDTPWRIVGVVLHYEDHGVRAEGTDRPKDE